MKLGLLPGKFAGRYDIDMELVREAEDLGFDSAWTSEAWGNDAITPAGLRVSGEVADGGFPIYMDPTQFDIIGDPLAEGFAKAGNGKSLADYKVSPFVAVEVGDDIEACRAPVKREMALYIGGMGARDKNYYNDYAKKLGFEAAAVEIQDHFLAGRRAEAEAAVPNELVDAVALVGPKERIMERIGVWKDAAAKGHIDTMVVRRPARESMRTIAEAVL